MGLISNVIDNRKVWRALRNYPVYSPPFHDAEAVLAKREIKANFDYFLEQKAKRLEYLAKYMAQFSVDLPLERDALPALDGWLYRYGGHLIPSGGEVIGALADYEPAWDGVFRGLNIINDISIFAGDYIISKNKDVRWDVWYGDGTKRDYEKQGFGQPCLFGLRHFIYLSPYSMLRAIADCCNAGRLRILRGRRGPKYEWDAAGDVVRWLSYLSDPDPPPPVPFSQLTIDD
jgi:hypothetical protein